MRMTFGLPNVPPFVYIAAHLVLGGFFQTCAGLQRLPELCLVVKLPSRDRERSGGSGLSNQVAAVRATWGPRAVFVATDAGQHAMLTTDTEEVDVSVQYMEALLVDVTREVRNRVVEGCAWLLLVASVWVYVNIPAIVHAVQHLNSSMPWPFHIGSRSERKACVGGGDGPKCFAFGGRSVFGRQAVRAGGGASDGNLLLISAGLVTRCMVPLLRLDSEDLGSAGSDAHKREFAQCLMGASLGNSSEMTNLGGPWDAVVESDGFHGFARRHSSSCLLAVLRVSGWVHMMHIHNSVRDAGGMSKQCPVGEQTSQSSGVASSSAYASSASPERAPDSVALSPTVLNATLCVFVPLDIVTLQASDVAPPVAAHGDGAATAEAQQIAELAHAVGRTWATNSTIFLLPPSSTDTTRGLETLLEGLRVEGHLAQPSEGAEQWSALMKALGSWRHILLLARSEAAAGCDWVMKAHLRSYVNARAIEQRLACLNSSIPWYLGATISAFVPGHEPFYFPSEKAGAIVSRGAYEMAAKAVEACIRQWLPTADGGGMASAEAYGDYAFALCLSDVANLKVGNYADVESSFVLTERPSRTLQLFDAHASSLKQCLFGVGWLATPEDIEHVHKWIVWSEWHTSVPCVGISQTGVFKMVDVMGSNQLPYYDERIRQAIYYCKDPDMLRLEVDLAQRLGETDTQSDLTNSTYAPPTGARLMDSLGRVMPPTLSKGTRAPLSENTSSSRDELPGLADQSDRRQSRRHLCIFVPSSVRKRRFVDAAEAAWRNWGTEDTFFVAPKPGLGSSLLENNSFVSDLDLDTDYARLPVRTLRLFEALGRPDWVDECDWYMKADADSYLNVPLVAERLRCFDATQDWYLGVPQVAHSGGHAQPIRFASGGAGYIVSKGLLPKVASWVPYCLLQLLQQTGGTGMEDVAFAECLWKWGRVAVASYVDASSEVITSEAALQRTRVATWRTDGLERDGLENEDNASIAKVPACTFVVHSLEPEELPAARENIRRARAAAKASCRPDPQHLAWGANFWMAPEGEGALDHPGWPVYAESEFVALRGCSAM